MREKIHVFMAELLAKAQACGDHEAAGALHASLKESAEWSTLPLKGYQEAGTYRLELRDCPRCGSTLAKKIL